METIVITAEPLAKGFARVLGNGINLLGNGAVFYDGNVSVSIEAKHLNRPVPLPVTERNGNEKIMAFVLETLDEKIAPVFTKIAETIEKNSKQQKEIQQQRAKELLGGNPHGTSWILPTGYAFAEEVKIIFAGDAPKKVMVFYQQNLRGKLSTREKVFSLDDAACCLEQQKRLEDLLKQVRMVHIQNVPTYAIHHITGENGAEEGSFLSWLKLRGFLQQGFHEKYNCFYFFDNDQVWCSEHVPVSVTADALRKKCAWQQKLLASFLDLYCSAHARYPDLAKPNEKKEFADEIGCVPFLREPANSRYFNKHREIWCELHGKLH